MGEKTSKRYSSLKYVLNNLKLFMNFLLSGPDKSSVLYFLNFEFFIFQEFCSFSLTWDPMGAKTSKKSYSSLKSLLNPSCQAGRQAPGLLVEDHHTFVAE